MSRLMFGIVSQHQTRAVKERQMANTTRRIDSILTSPGDWDVSKYALLSDSNDLKYYSDHLPMIAAVEVRPD